jgi:hypothetical protein
MIDVDDQRLEYQHIRGTTTMKFMTMVSAAETNGPPPPALMGAIAKFGEEAMKAGVLVEQRGLHPSARGARVSVVGGKTTATDGPFAEAKELVGGYAVYDVKSKAEAVAWATRFMELHREHWPGWEGVTEIRQVFDVADFAP